jgi:hypothetical protein
LVHLKLCFKFVFTNFFLIGAAMGDLQCSVFANLLRPGLDAVINISTSGQLGFVMPNEFQPENLAKGTL